MSEVRLIDGNALEQNFDPDTWQGEMMIALVRNAPTITPESLGYRKVVHGRWENTVKWWQGGSAWKRCSVCGIISKKTRYCRNCGARMIEKTDRPHQG